MELQGAIGTTLEWAMGPGRRDLQSQTGQQWIPLYPSHPHGESNLNVQYAEAIAYRNPTPIIFYNTGRAPGPPDRSRSEWFLQWLKYVLDQEDIPQTISTSYGYPENFVSKEYASNVCDMSVRLSLRGVSISVLFLSGDDGVGKGNCDSETQDV